jgi:class 3 adenylate cyclase
MTNRSTFLPDMPAERRLAAILAADVVGYSRLMGADEVGTLRALKALRGEILHPLIGFHRGRIVKTTGDGVLVEFASVIDAVNCAVAIQRELRLTPARTQPQNPLTLRIGVNIGDIIIDGADIFGDGVNLASRLESICEPGGVTISRAVHEQVRDKLAFPFVDQGEQSVKNIVRPVGVFGIGPQAIGALPASALPGRAQARLPAIEPQDEPAEPRGTKPKRTRWRTRLILLAVVLLVLSRQAGVRHAFDNFLAWAIPAPAKAPPAKPAELAPLPPPIFVPSPPTHPEPPDGTKPPGGAEPAGGEKPPGGAEPPMAPPIELHPQD